MKDETRQSRKLAAIMFADISGYTALMQSNEAEARKMLEDFHKVLKSGVAAQGGQIINDYGDGCLCIFESAVAALKCALNVQTLFTTSSKVPVRLGLHSGDVFFEQDNVYGDSVNLASRIESLGVPGSVLFSEAMQAQVKNKPEFTSRSLGTFAFKNVDSKMEVFALQNGGLVLPKRVNMQGKLKKSNRAPLFIAAGVLAGVLGFGLVSLGDKQNNASDPIQIKSELITRDSTSQKLASPPISTPAASNMIAVLPFANRSAREEDAYFAEGMHDDLLTQLSKISALQVISRTSVMRFMDTDVPIPEIAKTLGVATILEGAVQRAGDRVRITVTLIDGQTDTQIWSDSYNRELTTENIFDIQEEITLAIAEATQAALTTAELAKLKSQPTQSLSAYDAYIRGQLQSRFGVSSANDYSTAIGSYDAAIAADPNFAEAYAGKAYSALYLYWLYGRDKSNVVLAKEALTKAQTLAPDEIETLIAEAYYNYWGLQDYAKADKTLDRAIVSAPNNPEVWAIKAYVARRDGRFEEAISALEKSHRLDPLKYITAQELANTYSELGYFDKARVMMERAKKISPNSQWTRAFDAYLWWQRGDAQKAWDTINVPIADPAVFYLKQMILHAMNTRDPEKVDFALELWPEEKRNIGKSPESYSIMRVRALFATNREDEAKDVLYGVRARLRNSNDPYPSGWSGNAAYLPVTVPGLSGNLKAVNRAVKDYNKIETTDAWSERDVLYGIALAYAHAGDPETAFEYVGKLVDKFGPGIYLRLTINPDFDDYREHKAYLDLKAKFEAR